MVDALIAVGDIAAMLGIARQNADAHTRRPGFPAPAMTAGRTRLWRKRDVEAWIAVRRESQSRRTG